MDGVLLSREMYEKLVKLLEASASARPPRYVEPPRIRRPVESPATGFFLAQITHHTQLDSPIARWGYDWQQVARAADGSVAVVEDGRSGSWAAGGYAYNIHEDSNVDQRDGVQGDGVDQTESGYQATSYNLLPIGGGALTTGDSANNVTVWMKTGRTTTGEVVYEFAAMNAHGGTCTSG